MNIGVTVRNRRTGSIGIIAGPRQASGLYHVRFNGATANVHEDDLAPVEGETTAGTAGRDLGERIAGGPIERKDHPNG